MNYNLYYAKFPENKPKSPATEPNPTGDQDGTSSDDSSMMDTLGELWDAGGCEKSIGIISAFPYTRWVKPLKAVCKSSGKGKGVKNTNVGGKKDGTAGKSDHNGSSQAGDGHAGVKKTDGEKKDGSGSQEADKIKNEISDILKNVNLQTIKSEELIVIFKKNPKIGSELISKISKEFGASIKSHPLRQSYETEVQDLSVLAKKLKSQGSSEEAIARRLSQSRRDLGVKYKEISPQLLKEYIYDVNLKRYKDPLGPNIEFLLNEGKTWSEIIQSSYKPNPDIDILLGGFEKWMQGKCGI